MSQFELEFFSAKLSPAEPASVGSMIATPQLTVEQAL